MLGLEMMLTSMGLDPEEIKSYVEKFGTIIIAAKEQLDRIERNQVLIMEKLGIEPEAAAPANAITNEAATEGTE